MRRVPGFGLNINKSVDVDEEEVFLVITDGFLEFLQVFVRLKLLGPLGIALHRIESRENGPIIGRCCGYHLGGVKNLVERGVLW